MSAFKHRSENAEDPNDLSLAPPSDLFRLSLERMLQGGREDMG